MIWHHYLASAFMLLGGIYVTMGAIQLGIGSASQPGPGFIFLLSGSILGGLSVIDLVNTIREHKSESALPKPMWNVRWGKVILVLAAIGLYAIVLETLGFALSTFVLMLFLFKVIEPVKWKDAMIGSLLTIVIVYAVFAIWLKVPFPSGIFQF